ncbi:hypothetical protein ACFLRU_07485 [Bacteroidota bacterium]
MEHKKGLLRCITIQIVITLLMAISIHYVLKEFSTSYEFLKLTFPKSLALAIFFKLAFYSPSIDKLPKV